MQEEEKGENRSLPRTENKIKKKKKKQIASKTILRTDFFTYKKIVDISYKKNIFIISKKSGKATKRNLTRRLLRYFFSKLQSDISVVANQYYMVIVNKTYKLTTKNVLKKDISVSMEGIQEIF
jgi:ribonuclease P protein component